MTTIHAALPPGLAVSNPKEGPTPCLFVCLVGWPAILGSSLNTVKHKEGSLPGAGFQGSRVIVHVGCPNRLPSLLQSFSLDVLQATVNDLAPYWSFVRAAQKAAWPIRGKPLILLLFAGLLFS